MEPSDIELRNAITGLLKTLKETYTSGNSSGSMFDFKPKTKPYWAICVDKFFSTWSAFKPSQSIDGFYPCFRSFYELNRDNLIQPFFDEEDMKPIDDWLKNDDINEPAWKQTKKKKKTSSVSRSSDSWSPKINLTGQVIYFDDLDPSLEQIAIPISEGYRAAVSIYKEGASRKEPHYSPLPAKVLYYLFLVSSFFCKIGDKRLIQNNISSIKKILDSLTTEDTGEGSTLDPMKGMLKMLTKQFGGADVDDSKLTQMMGSLFNPEVSGKLQKAVEEIGKKLTPSVGGKTDFGAIMSQVGSVLQQESAQSLIQETVEIASRVAAGEEAEFSAAGSTTGAEAACKEPEFSAAGSTTGAEAAIVSVPEDASLLT